MSAPVEYQIQDNIAVVTIDNPPVNALGVNVRAGLVGAVQKASDDNSVRAVLIRANGRTFPAGADINEFGKTPQSPSLPEVCDSIEACEKPVIAALHGTVLGGGLEVALAAHYRIAEEGTKLGLPEVTLGLLPGAGGTQRTPRLCGVEKALQLMLSGKPVSAAVAQSFGLIDELTGDSAAKAGLAMAREVVRLSAPPRRTMEWKEGLKDPAANIAAIKAARAQHKGSPLLAPGKIIDCVEASLLLPPEAGKTFERAAFEECLASGQSAALRHVFLAERRTRKVPELKSGKPRDIRRVGVIGGGTMGAGIAVSLLDAGLDVVMLERDNDSLEAGLGRVVDSIERSLDKGRISAAQRDERLARFEGTLNYTDFMDVDLAIEAVVEDRTVKEEVLSRLDAVLKPGAIFATNTSYLDIDRLAVTVSRPQDVIGLHFFSPANIMKLLEIVVTESVSDDVVATGFALAKRLGKIGVRARVTDGFIGNRILKAYRLAAEYAVQDGASPYQVDRAMRAYGFRLGPFQVYDLAGLDIAWAQRKRSAASRDPEMRYVTFGDRMCEAGWLGQKTGRGYYRYAEGSRKGDEDQEVLDLIAAERSKKGIRPRNFSDDEIQRRCVAAMVNEGAKLLEEGIALRPSDIDVVMIHGYGFPRWRGGPMKAADLRGLLQVQKDLLEFAGKGDAKFWQPSKLFEGLMHDVRGFDVLNA